MPTSSAPLPSTPPRCCACSKTGSLEPGKLADIVAVEGNPLDDIKAMLKVTFVMKDGKLVKNN